MTFQPLFGSVAAFATALVASSFIAGDARANMAVYPMAMSVGGETNTPGIIRVYSKSDDIQYVKVQVKRVFDPGTPQEREEVAAGWNGKQLIVSPAKFALPAGASRAVRVVNLSPPDREEVYRAYFEAIPAPAESEAAHAGASAKVNVSLVWGALIRARPATSAPDFRVTGNDLRNTGNVRISVSEISRCSSAAANDCQWQAVQKSVFPGATLSLPLGNQDGPLHVRFNLDGVSGVQTRSVVDGSAEHPLGG